MKRSKPLRARKKLRRKSAPRRARAKSKYRRRERQLDYMLGVKQLPCAALIVPGHECEGPIEADHAGGRGMGQKAHDSTVIPLCQLAHRQRTDFTGVFRGWDQAQMRDFLLGRIIQTQRAMLARGFLIPASELVPTKLHLEDPDRPGYMFCGRLIAIPPPLAEDIREEGNLDVRHPDAAPLPAARVVTEGDQHR